jgi:hypothetical protein
MDGEAPKMPIPFLDNSHFDEGTKEHKPQDRSLWNHHQHQVPELPHHDQSPPAYAAAPPSGYRIAMRHGEPFPVDQRTMSAPCRDLDGSPVYLGSALMDGSVHPCKIAPHLPTPCRVPYGGREHEHHGRFDLLPYDHATMEFVHTTHGHIPAGRRPVDGGYEEQSEGGAPKKLYHAVATVRAGNEEVRVPGKTGVHLVRFVSLGCSCFADSYLRYQGGCNVPFGGGEMVVRENYQILYESTTHFLCGRLMMFLGVGSKRICLYLVTVYTQTLDLCEMSQNQ